MATNYLIFFPWKSRTFLFPWVQTVLNDSLLMNWECQQKWQCVTLKLEHRKHVVSSISLLLNIFSEKSLCHVMRTLKQPCGEVHVARGLTSTCQWFQWVIVEADPPLPLKPTVDCSLSQHLYCKAPCQTTQLNHLIPNLQKLR